MSDMNANERAALLSLRGTEDTQDDTTERERTPKYGTPPMNPPRNTARRTPCDTGENGADTLARFAARDGNDRRTKSHREASE